jgi:hypothetical protein
VNVARIAESVLHPAHTATRLRARADASRLAERHSRLARRRGIDRPYLILSFDCDLHEDAEVVWDVHTRLMDRGVVAVYAVPGAMLESGREVYARIAATGAEFMNHGQVEHTYWDADHGRYASCFFYDEVGRDAVRADIEAADRTLRDVLGVEPAGFRAPHFGTFQRPSDLRFTHGVLRGLGYRYASSTMPFWGLRHGPVFDRFGLPELPVSGRPSAPLEILDSWSCFAAPDRVRTAEDFRTDARALARQVGEHDAGVINVYADPSHIHDQPAFFDAVAAWAEVAEPTSYRSLLDRLG